MFLPESGMSGLDVTRRYFDGWNAYDGQAVLDCFADGGTYEDTTTRPISGESIAKMVNDISSWYEGMRFEIVSLDEVTESMVVCQWIMHGKIEGKDTALEGADFITIEDDKITKVKGYYDSVGVSRQLGKKIITQ